MRSRGTPGSQRLAVVVLVGTFALSACESGSSPLSPSAGTTTAAADDCSQSSTEARASQARLGPSINPGPPTAIFSDVFTYDCARHEAIKFGGQTNEFHPRFNDQTWAWRGGNWAELTTRHAPSPRAHAVMGYDAAERQIVLFGGDGGHFTNQGQYEFLNDTWTWDGLDWSQVPSPQAPPPTHIRFAFAYFAPLKGMVLAADDGTWLYRSGSWARLADTPSIPFGSTMVYMPNLAKLFLYVESPNRPNAWLFDGNRWSRDPVDDRTGPGYGSFGMVYDSKEKQALYVNVPIGFSAGVYATSGNGWVHHPAELPNPDKAQPVGIVYAADLGVMVEFGADRTTGRIVTGWSWTGNSWQLFSR